MVHDGSLITDEEVDRMWEFSRYPGSMDAMFRGIWDGLWDDFTSNEIEKITTNILLIWEKKIPFAQLIWGVWYCSCLPQLEIYSDCQQSAHNPHFECPDVCLDEITFLAGDLLNESKGRV